MATILNNSNLCQSWKLITDFEIPAVFWNLVCRLILSRSYLFSLCMHGASRGVLLPCLVTFRIRHWNTSLELFLKLMYGGSCLREPLWTLKGPQEAWLGSWSNQVFFFSSFPEFLLAEIYSLRQCLSMVLLCFTGFSQRVFLLEPLTSGHAPDSNPLALVSRLSPFVLLDLTASSATCFQTELLAPCFSFLFHLWPMDMFISFFNPIVVSVFY